MTGSGCGMGPPGPPSYSASLQRLRFNMAHSEPLGMLGLLTRALWSPLAYIPILFINLMKLIQACEPNSTPFSKDNYKQHRINLKEISRA